MTEFPISAPLQRHLCATDLCIQSSVSRKVTLRIEGSSREETNFGRKG